MGFRVFRGSYFFDETKEREDFEEGLAQSRQVAKEEKGNLYPQGGAKIFQKRSDAEGFHFRVFLSPFCG